MLEVAARRTSLERPSALGIQARGAAACRNHHSETMIDPCHKKVVRFRHRNFKSRGLQFIVFRKLCLPPQLCSVHITADQSLRRQLAV